MKYLVLLAFLISPLWSIAQPNFEAEQQQWLRNIEKGESIAEFQWTQGHLLFIDGNVENDKQLNTYQKEGGIPMAGTYRQSNAFKHDERRYVTLGTGTAGERNFLIASAWRNTVNGWKKEINVLLTLEADTHTPFKEVMEGLEAERKKWVQLANEHDPPAHISNSYSREAVYFSNGQRSDGHEGIANRYAYMKNPDYQVDLEKKFLQQISPGSVLEVGRYYAGRRENNPGGLYMILWEKTEGNRWQIALDFNF